MLKIHNEFVRCDLLVFDYYNGTETKENNNYEKKTHNVYTLYIVQFNTLKCDRQLNSYKIHMHNFKMNIFYLKKKRRVKEIYIYIERE